MKSAAYPLTNLIHCLFAEVLACGFALIDTNLVLTYPSLSYLIYCFNVSMINSYNILLAGLEYTAQLLSYCLEV